MRLVLILTSPGSPATASAAGLSRPASGRATGDEGRPRGLGLAWSVNLSNWPLPCVGTGLVPSRVRPAQTRAPANFTRALHSVLYSLLEIKL